MPLITSASIEDEEDYFAFFVLWSPGFFFSLIIVGILLIPFYYKLSQHALDVIQGLLLSPRSLPLYLHMLMEVIIIIVISHLG